MNANLLREYASYPGLLRDLLRVKRRIEPERIVYGGDRRQYFLDFAPPGRERCTAVIYIHGGGWDSGEPAMFRFIGQYFALQGYRCFLPGYRHAPKFRYPAQAEDVCAAAGAILRRLDREGGPPRPAAVVGSSAGAHLGALLCLDRQLQKQFDLDPGRLAGFAGLGGPYDFEDGHPAVLYLLARKLFPVWEERRQGAPREKLAFGGGIPLLVIHSPRDGVAGYENAWDFARRARELGLPVRFFSVPPGRDSHSAYTAGIFLEGRENSPALDALTDWLGRLERLTYGKEEKQ